MRTINEIIFHCSATKPSMNIGADWIRELHIKEKGYNDIGYHFVVRRNGAIEDGRPMGIVGAHCLNHNTNTIGVCLVGGIDINGKPENNFTPEQFESAQLLTNSLVDLLPSIKKLSGHKDYAQRACPCFEVKDKIILP